MAGLEASQVSEDMLEPRADDTVPGLPEQADLVMAASGANLADPATATPQSAGDHYDAFISYSHAADHTLAPAIQHGLQALAKPLYERRALRVFRDKTSLAVTPGLWPTIQQALEASRYFILLASPTAAKSNWVQQELAWWIRHRKPGTLLIVLTAGTIAWDQTSGDFAWHETDTLPKSDALPTTLSGWFGEEPLWVDLRWAQTASRLSHRDPQLRDDLATLAAPLRGVPKDDLVGLDLVLHRRAVRLRRIALVLLVLLTLGALGGALVAVEQRDTAREQTLTATSRQLVAQATSIQDSQPNLARQLLAQAYRLAPTDQAVGALLGSSSIPRVIPVRGDSRSVSIAYGPHRDMFAIASDEGVTLYGARTETALATLGGQSGHVGVMAFSPDDRLLAVGDADGRIRLWDVTSARHPTPVGAVVASTGAIRALSFSSEARFLTVVAERAAGVLDIRDRHRPRMIATIPGVPSAGLSDGLALSPDGRVMASSAQESGNKETVRLWDLSKPSSPALLASLEGSGGSLAFSPDGQLLAAGEGGVGQVTRLWDVGDPVHPKQRALLAGQSFGIDAVAFSADGATLATGAGDRSIQLWDVADPIRPAQGARLTGHTDSVEALAFSGDGHTLASVSADGAATDSDGFMADRTVRLWSVIGSERTSAAAKLASAAGSLPAFSPDSRTMAAGFPMTLWDLNNRTNPRSLATVPTFAQGQPAVDLSPDSQTLATGLPVVLWDVTDRVHPRTLTPRTRITESAQVVRFSPTAPLLVVAAHVDGLQLWDVSHPERPTHLATLEASQASPQGVAFRRDGRLLATLTSDAVQLWDVAHPSTPRLLDTFKQDKEKVQALAFSPDGRTLLTGDTSGVVTSWDAKDPSHVRQLGLVGRHTGPVGGVAFHPGGTIAASASDDGTIRLWNVADPSRPIEMTALSGGGLYDSAALVFSPDGRTLAAASANDLQLWDVDMLGILQRLCAQSPRITPAQWRQYLPDRPYDPPCA
jgi:WD40 repeat protein